MENTINNQHESDTLSRLTRQQVADQLRVSVATVRRMEGRELHPAKNDKGVWTFDASEVTRIVESRLKTRKIRKNNEGEVAARIFELFEQGYDLSEIVITARQPPRVVRELYSEWIVGLQTGEKKRQREQIDAKMAHALSNLVR